MGISFCCIRITFEPHRSLSFDINACRQTPVSQERIQFVHSNDASSDHMQLYPSRITSLKLKSLNKSLVIPLRSIQKLYSAITTTFFGNIICPNFTLIELNITLSRPYLINQIQLEFYPCCRMEGLIWMTKSLELLGKLSCVGRWGAKIELAGRPCKRWNWTSTHNSAVQNDSCLSTRVIPSCSAVSWSLWVGIEQWNGWL